MYDKRGREKYEYGKLVQVVLMHLYEGHLKQNDTWMWQSCLGSVSAPLRGFWITKQRLTHLNVTNLSWSCTFNRAIQCTTKSMRHVNFTNLSWSFTLLTASHRMTHHRADLESSTQLSSGAIMRCHMPHLVHIHRINGSTALRRLMMCENVLWYITPSKV